MNERYRVLMHTIAGNAMLAFAVCAIVVPHGIMMGGANGVALCLREFIPAPLSVLAACVNCALFLLGWACMGRQFALRSLLSTLVYPLMVALFEALPVEMLFAGEDKLICTLLCAVLVGAGVGLVVRVGGSTGGMDIPPCILQKWKGIPVGRSLLFFDGLILLGQVLSRGADGVLYAVLNLALTSLIVDRTIVSGEQKVEIIVISPKYEAIRRAILHHADCGATMLEIETGLRGEKQQAILSIVYAAKYPAIRDIALRIDPKAFIVAADVKKVNGLGYTLKRNGEALPA